jgi:hypothetical protein
MNVLRVGGGEGSVDIDFFDKLNYSQAAAGGEAALNRAVIKASNATFGWIRSVWGALAEKINAHDIAFQKAQSIPYPFES